MSNNNATPEFDINSLLDGTLDDLADMPEFKPFPAGTHRVIFNLEYKVVNKHPSYEAKMKAEETIELANVEDVPLVKGAETSVLYMLDNEIGQGQFKRILVSLSAKFGQMSNRELIAEAKNLEVLVVTKTRPNKDKTVVYTEIVELQVL